MIVGVTGHRGFLGKNLIEKLQKEGHEVVKFVGDVARRGHVILDAGIAETDIVVHLAGKNKGTPEEIISTNVDGSINIIDECIKHKKPLIIAGSNYSHEGPYKQSKLAIKELCKAYQYRGLNSTILTLPKLYGRWCKPHYNSFVTTLIYIASKGVLDQYLYLIKDLDEKVELLRAEDACDVILEHIKRPALMSGYAEYIFTKYDGLITVTFREIVDALKGSDKNPNLLGLVPLMNWYKENDIYG